MKRLWIGFKSLSRSKQIGVFVLAAHAAVVLMLAVNSAALPQKTKKAIAIRTILAPGEKKNSGSARKVAPVQAKRKAPAPQAASKKKETSPSPKKKFSSEEGIDSAILQQLAESLGSIAGQAGPSKRPNFAVSLPPSVQMEEETLVQPRYGEIVSAILQNQLALPEFGEVVAKIDIDANGIVTQCEILETKSRKNAEFLKKRLQELAFPCFNEYGLSENNLNFTITFHNVENTL